MQWVETLGRTVEEAVERALDALGVDDADAEIEVVEEPVTGRHGHLEREARVRARVRPNRPRPKLDRRSRRRTKDGPRDARAGVPAAPAPGADQAGDAGRGAAAAGGGRRSGRRRPSRGDGERTGDVRGAADAAPHPGSSAADWRPGDEVEAAVGFDGGDAEVDEQDGDQDMSDVHVDEQRPTAVQFVEGLVAAFGFPATVRAESPDEETLELHIEGSDLGLLVGQRGATLSALQELTRTAVAQQHSGRLEGRIRIDVAGYRARRKVALERFAAETAEKVKETGRAVAMEPMSPPDRKIIHDAINEIAGVTTTSEGEDARRHVVVRPE